LKQDADDHEVLSMLETSVRGFLALKHDRRRLRETRGGFPLWTRLAELGVLAASLPEAEGGAAMGAGGIALVSRILGEHLVPEPYVACAVMPAAIVARLPAGPVRTDLAQTLASGAERLSLAWQEQARQTAPFPAAARLESGSRLSGVKRFVVAPDRRALVTAQAGGEPIIVLADLTAPGVTLVSAAASDGTAYAELTFTDAPVEGGAPILSGAAAAAAACAALHCGLIGASAQLTGLIAGVLDLTLEHLRTRVQFERPIGSFQALQHRAVDMRISLALAEASVREAVRLCNAEPGSARASAAASAAKARASEAALRVCKEAIQMHGAIGFTEEADVGLFARVALKGASWLGGAREHRARFIENQGEAIHGR
jgi:alkylation response protein AidB-like acyl-CoA dehydrogenase